MRKVEAMQEHFYRDDADRYPETQENPVTEMQENPIVSKLREAFDSATSAILEGTELAKSVVELRKQVDNLTASVSILERDLEYVRNRNRELDEQVTQVRRARDEAIADAAQARNEWATASNERDRLQSSLAAANTQVDSLSEQLRLAKADYNSAMAIAQEMENKLNEANAKLEAIGKMFDKPLVIAPEAPKPVGWPSQAQPRDPETQQFRSPYDSGSQGTY